MKLGVLTDGISQDLEHALTVMGEFGLDQAELQYVWGKAVGELDAAESRRARDLVRQHRMTVSSVSPYAFAGMPVLTTKAGDAVHTTHMETLKRCIGLAHLLDCDKVRILSGRKEMILWGAHGAEYWNVTKGAWDAMLELMAPAVDLAHAEGITLLVETGNGTMVNSAWTGRRMLDDLNAGPALKVLWDPGNACYAHETAWPDAYDALRGGHVGHIHIKDVWADTAKAWLEVRPMGEGMLADSFAPIASALRADRYDGAISYESVYHPGNGSFEDGFRHCIVAFLQLFGEDAG